MAGGPGAAVVRGPAYAWAAMAEGPAPARIDLDALLGPLRREETLEGVRAAMDSDAARAEALERAFDYRGDVTLTLADGSTLTGYIFDRRRGATAGESFVRLLPPGSDRPVRIPYARIVALEFSGKDAAHGRSWESWVRRYARKVLAQRGLLAPDQAGAEPD